MHLITASILMVATLSVVNAQDDTPQAGYILGGAHSEFGVSSHMLYVTYPGIEDEKASFVIQHQGEGDETYKDIHTYHLDTAYKAKTPYTYFFALDGTKKGNYTVKFCKADGTTCSKPSSPPTVIDDGQGKLDCKEYDDDVKDISIPEITKYATQDELTKYKEKMTKSIATKQGITKNPSFKVAEKETDKGFMYFLIQYQLGAFAKLFTVPSEKDEDKYCQKKYTFMVVTQVIEKSTKQVLARGRFTATPLNETLIEKYITKKDPNEIAIEFKLDISKELYGKNDLKTWHTVCISAKDMVTSREKGFAVKCSEPFENDLDWDNVKEEETSPEA